MSWKIIMDFDFTSWEYCQLCWDKQPRPPSLPQLGWILGAGRRRRARFIVKSCCFSPSWPCFHQFWPKKNTFYSNSIIVCDCFHEFSNASRIQVRFVYNLQHFSRLKSEINKSLKWKSWPGFLCESWKYFLKYFLFACKFFVSLFCGAGYFPFKSIF